MKAKYIWSLTICALLLLVILFGVMMLFVFRDPAEPTGTESVTERQTDADSESSDETGTETVTETETQSLVTKPTRDEYLPADTKDTAEMRIASLSSQEAILVDLSDLSVIASMGADERIYPASMTKVMTLIVACDYITNLDRVVTVSQEAIDYAKANEASVAGFDAEDTCTVRDLFYGVAVKSGAEATYLLAREALGSEEAFVSAMNEKCRELGLTQTHFTNSAGFFDADHYTTVREMAAIFAYALDNPFCKILLSTVSYETYPGYLKNGVPATYRLTFYSTLFVSRFQNDANLSGGMTLLGGKTGYIDYRDGFKTVKDYTLVTYAGGVGERYLVVTAGAASAKATAEDHRAIYQLAVK